MHQPSSNWIAVLLTALLGVGCDGPAPEPDAGARDATIQPPECARDVDCDDGVFCNGAEACEARECRGGEAPSCDDGDVCTADACSEEEAACVSTAIDADGDGHIAIACAGDDCDDEDALRFPGNLEICDAEGHDEDCDPSTFGEQDFDGDGAYDARCCNTGPSGETCGTDCDDVRPSVVPGASEACDGVDNDCDSSVDEGVAVAGYVDDDGDLHGDPDRPISACAGLPRFSSLGDDCDDANPARHGAQAEVCDDVDNDCDGTVDEDTREVSWYADADGDGFGDPAAGAIRSCTPIAGRSLLGTDCDDRAGAIHPAAAERCDGIDNDCNGLPDYRLAPGDLEDDDGDGFIDAACEGGMDCDDRNPEIAGGFPEICDGRDNDCDGTVDEDTSPVVWFADLDGDGYGSSASGAVVSCTAVAGHSLRGGDCDDRDAARRPFVTERCDGLDDDCDTAIDEGLSRGCGSDVGVCAAGRQACVSGIWSACNGVGPSTESCNGLDDDCDGTPDDGLSCP